MNKKEGATAEQTSDSLLCYLKSFMSQSEAGLIISETNSGIGALAKFLTANRFTESQTADRALELLSNQISTFVMLTPPLDAQMYYLLCQYANRSGLIQILNRKTYELSLVNIEPRESRLLFIATKSDLLAIEQRYPLRDKFGFIERYTNKVAA